MKTTAQLIKITFLSLVVGCLLKFPVEIKAQSALGLSAIPPRLEVTIKPGEYVTKEIKIRNESSVERIINTEVVDFIVADDKGTPVQLKDVANDNRWAASSWIHVGRQTKIKPGETKSVMVTIVVPEDATPGGHYAMILHNPNNEAVLLESGSAAAIETNVGTLVYITVPGVIKQDARVDYFTAPKFQEYGPINFKSAITNLSDIHIKPIGTISITNLFGGKTANLTFNDKDYNIFPATKRTFDNKLDRKFLFGRYKASLNATYGTAGGVLAATVFFWVIPWRLLLLIAAAILIVILLILLFKQPTIIKEKEDTIDDLEKELEKLKKKYKDNK